MEHYTWQQIEREMKIDNFKRKVKEKATKVKDFVIENKRTIVVATPIAIAAFSEINKAANRHERAKEERRRDSRVYDPSLGYWWDLKKPLTNNERLEMEARIANGEKRGDILRDMGKLKK